MYFGIFFVLNRLRVPNPQQGYRVFSLTWPAFMQIYWNKRKRLHKKGVQLPEDWFGTPIWPPFHCFGAPIWPPWRHVKTIYWHLAHLYPNIGQYSYLNSHSPSLPGNVDPSFPGPALADGGFQPVFQPVFIHVLCWFFRDLAEMEGRR